MPSFQYVAFSADGEKEQGSVDAPTDEKAWDDLAMQGLTVVSLTSAATTIPRQRPSFFATSQARIPVGAQADLAEELAILFNAHLPAHEIVRILSVGAEHPTIRRHFIRMSRLLADGIAFPSAFERAGTGFSPLFSSLVQLGQTTADPAPTMQKLASALRRQEKLRAELTGALTYPAILACGALAVFFLMVLYLAPKLEPMFASVERPMPGTIAFFLAVRDLLLHDTYLLAALVIIGTVGLKLVTARSSNVFSQLFARLPIWGNIAISTSLARLARSLNLMLAAGVPLSSALEQTAQQLATQSFAADFAKAAASVQSGGTASVVFSETPRLPIVFRELFSLGERTNALPSIMDTLATLLEDAVERKTQRITKLITPVLTLIIGGGVGGLVYSVMAAILSVNDLAF